MWVRDCVGASAYRLTLADDDTGRVFGHASVMSVRSESVEHFGSYIVVMFDVDVYEGGDGTREKLREEVERDFSGKRIFDFSEI